MVTALVFSLSFVGHFVRLRAAFPMTTIQDGKLLIATTPSVQGWRIVHYSGIVAGEAIIGANIFRDVFATVRDIVGGRSGIYERALAEAREIASDEARQRALQLKCNAIVSADIDYEVINGMLMVALSGTAVRIEPEAA
jgi:uncharacterized protein YbjQ (UPF0145 family)